MGRTYNFYKQDIEPHKTWLNKEYLIQLNITGNCPLNCDFCYIKPYKNKELTLQDIEYLWKNLKKYNKKLNIVYRVNLTGGDIFLNKDWIKICEFFKNERSVIAVDPLINKFWKKDHKKLLDILDKKINYIQMNLDVVQDKDIILAQKKGKKRVVLKFSLYKGDYKRDIKKLEYFASKFKNVIVSIDIIIPQKSGLIREKNFLFKDYTELKKIINLLSKKFGKQFWFLSTISKRIIKKQIYYCPVPFGGVYIMPDGKVVPCSRYSHLETGFNIQNFDLLEYVNKFNKLCSNFCLFENKYFKDFWNEEDNPINKKFWKGVNKNG